MADTKISGMTAASALTGAEVLPVVQSAANVKATTQQVVDAAMTTGLTRQALGSISTNTTIDWSAGSYVTATIGGALTFTFSNPAPTGKACVAYLQLTNGGSAVITWPVSVTWSGGTAPTLSASGVDLLRFYTQDNGNTWFGTAENDEVLPAATTTTSGVVELATEGEAIAGVSTTLAVTPAGLAAMVLALGNGNVITDVYGPGTYTWEKSDDAQQVDVILVGAGGPGASGGCGAVNTTKTGGGGGGAGAIVVWSFDARELPSSVEVAVGSSTGGAAVGPTAADGNTPTQPVDTTFGAILKAKAGLVGSAAGTGGASQSIVSITRGAAAWNGPAGGGSGMPSTAVPAITPGSPTSGGGGGGVWNSGISYAGGAGGSWSSAGTIFPSIVAAAGGAAGSAGTAGGSAGMAGLGGGGGGSSHTGNGGAGGAGGFPGGGGGGGGACWAGYMSGAGGAGGDGLCIVIQRL